jgi:hypothetical protein
MMTPDFNPCSNGTNRSDIDLEERFPAPVLSPDEAQSAVERILYPRLWYIQDRRQLAWPGDLADDEDDS